MSSPGEGKAYQWIRDHMGYAHDGWCLIWPFSKIRGYGTFSYLGKYHYAHRFMCELAHGPAPSEIHQAAHGCGDEGCVNPRHLSWKTPAENALDSRKHGTHVRSRYGSVGKLTPEQAGVILSLKGVKKLRELADEYGVSESAISKIWVGKTHYRPSKVNGWKPEEDQIIRDGISRGLDFTQLAALVPDRSHGGVLGRAYRLGLHSGRPPDQKKIRA